MIEISPKHREFYVKARAFLKDRIYIDYLRRFALGTDASCYRYIPQIVIRAYSEDEIIKILKLSDEYNLALTFRAYGSSLSGQGLSDSILVIATTNWDKIKVDNNSIKLGCGVIGSDANAALKDSNKKIGPDPATITMASIGGIVANNSSGMCCGVKQNSYQTIKSIRVILQDGTILDTSDKQSVESFLKTHKHIADSLLDLRKEILQDSTLKALINKKYKIKNTTGYSINSLLDFDDIKDILNHIFVGSEGTLGFISSVELYSLKDCKFKACGLLFYKNILEASDAVKILAKNDDIIQSAEIMDYNSLKSVQNLKDIPEILFEIKEGYTCILIQTQSDLQSELDENLRIIKDSLKDTNMAIEPLYSQDENEFSKWWKIRKGLLPIASMARDDGSSVITEDVCFEIDKLGDGITNIENLFKKYNFNGIIFGHALSGNVHFIITPNLNNKQEKKNFENLVFDMAKIVSSMGGSIKAEHGTGRMMSPFVEMEWGKKAYEINKRIKNIFDKKNLLNPDVIITNDPLIHTKNIKEMPKIEDFINKCMECGFCQKACPSEAFTLNPRQRITIWREMERLKELNSQESIALLAELQKQYQYMGNETCAACSMCASLCPLEIDTANIALNLRQKDTNKSVKHIIKNMSFYTKSASIGLNTIHSLSLDIFHNLSIKARNISRKIPYLPKNLPQGNKFSPQHKTQYKDSVVYFTTCINRTFKTNDTPLYKTVESLCNKANINVIYPKEIENMCCGKSFSQYKNLHNENTQKILKILFEASDNGKIPIILDHSACSMHLSKILKDSDLKIYDLPQYIYEVIIKKLKINKINEDVAVYAMCALKKSNQDSIIEDISKLCTNGKIIKNSIFCCGFAGNKGFFTPELNKNALKGLKNFYDKTKIKRGFSSSTTCEIGLNDYSNISWQNIAYLVDEVASKDLIE